MANPAETGVEHYTADVAFEQGKGGAESSGRDRMHHTCGILQDEFAGCVAMATEMDDVRAVALNQTLEIANTDGMVLLQIKAVPILGPTQAVLDLPHALGRGDVKPPRYTDPSAPWCPEIF